MIKNKINKILALKIIIIILYLAFSYSVFAQFEDSYNNNDFYLNSDPKSWDYSRVVWSKVPIERIGDIPTDKIVYTELSLEQKKALTAEQIKENLNSIDDLIELDHNRLKEVISNKYGVVVDIKSSASLKNGLLKALKGQATLSGNDYKNGLIQVTKDGDIIFVPDKKAAEIQISISNSDIITIDGGKDTVLHLSNGIKFKGKLFFNNGRIFIPKGEDTTINDIFVHNTLSNPGLEVFSDGEDHSKNINSFVSLNPKEKKGVITTSNLIGIKFLNGNPFFDIEETDNLAMDLGNTKIFFKRRDEKDLVPLLELQYISKEGYLNMNNDNIHLSFTEQKASQFIHPSLKITSVPMEIIEKDNEEQIISRNNILKKLVISNFNEYAYLDLGEVTGETDLISKDVASGYISSRLSYNSLGVVFSGSNRVTFLGFENNILYQNGEEILQTIPIFSYESPNGNHIEIKGDIDYVVLKRVVDSIETLPPDLMNSISRIIVTDYQSFYRICVPNSVACAFDDGSIIFNRDSIGYFSDFYHEAAHVRTFILEQEKEKTKMELLRFPTSDNIFKSTKLKSIKDGWLEIAGDVYLRDTKLVTIQDQTQSLIVIVWTDGTQGPRNGCIRPYGCTNYHEDVSTFIENVYKDPKLISALINPQSPTYDIRYSQKLDLLYKYGYITNGRYNTILQLSKLPSEFGTVTP